MQIGMTPNLSSSGPLLLLLLASSLTSLCSGNSWDQKCGWATINPQTTICCEGLIYVREGVQPTCCGPVAYDAFSAYCCNGRVQAKTESNRCCGKSTYDPRSQVCHHGSSIMQRSLPGSTCCYSQSKWTCCRKGQGCCRQRGAGSVDVPGFKPACCEISSTSRKARCCSIITQKTGVMPSCCDASRVKPTCCRTSSSSYECCQFSYGLPRCCRDKDDDDIYHPYHPPTTQAPKDIIPVHPTPLPKPGSCCFSRSPQPECCQARRPDPGYGTKYHVPDRSVQPSKPRCCIYRYSCCFVRNNVRQNQCCQRPSRGAKPLCCQRRAPENLPPPSPKVHKCYSCKISGTIQGPVPLVSSHKDQSNKVDYGAKDYSSTGGGPGWARLSCCQSNYHTQCCRNAHRLTGVYPECCDVSDISGGNTNQLQIPSSPGAKRKAVCSGQVYNITYQVCCYGVLRRRLGSQASCCGTHVFNSATHKCCSGDLRQLKKLVEDDEEIVNAKDEAGQTPLHKASKNGWLECVEFLLENGSTVNSTDVAGCTPLHLAASNGYCVIVRYLIEKGQANITHKTKKGHTARYMAKTRGQTKMVALFNDMENHMNASWLN